MKEMLKCGVRMHVCKRGQTDLKIDLIIKNVFKAASAKRSLLERGFLLLSLVSSKIQRNKE